ncbi:MAG: hypothetical protein SGJ18_07920 [Pseudomonadota bacterium]|nr:hypothetical protein [Pseudomonadota bacterium]
METRVKRIWITFFVAVIAFIFGVHRWMELRLISAAKRVEGGDALVKEYFDGNLGFTDLYQQIGQLKPKPEPISELSDEN